MKSKEELIQDFVDRQLSDEDQALFDQHWEDDQQFREDAARQKELSGILSSRLSKEADSLKTTLREVERAFRTGNPGKQQSGKIRRLIPMLAAACVLLAAVLFLFPWRQTQDLYELPRMRSEVVRGETATSEQRYEDAVNAFNAGRYGESTELLRNLRTQHPEIHQYLYYLGLSLIGEEKFKEAVPHLETLAEGESVFRNDALYYLAVALYKSGDTAEAVRRATSVPERADRYREAQRLLISIQK